ncbi:MAG: site-specific integrase [Actinomycetota bacterium]
MKGSMRRRGDSWQLRVYAGVDPVTGKERYVSRSHRGTKRTAEVELARFVAEVNDGLATATEATVNNLLDRWWDTASPDWSAATRREHLSIMRNHIRPMLGPARLSKLTASDLDHWYAELRKKPGRKSATLSPATVKRVAVVMNAALEQAVKWGWIPNNPARASSPPKVRPAKIAPPDTEQVARILDLVKVEDHPFWVFLRIAASTGARRSQVCGLQWADVDLAGARLLFTRAVVDGDNGIEVKGTKTDRAYRVALDRGSCDALRHHRSWAEQVAQQAETTLRPESFVFSYEVDGSKPWRPDGVSHRWRRWRKEADLPGVRLHDIRHFMATTMLTDGVPVSVVSGRLGHARASTTLNIYSHFVEAGDQDAADGIGSLLDGPMGLESDVHGQTMDSGGPRTGKAESEDPA